MMSHFRVATFDVTSGTLDELVEVIKQPGSFVDIFPALPGSSRGHCLRCRRRR